MSGDCLDQLTYKLKLDCLTFLFSAQKIVSATCFTISLSFSSSPRGWFKTLSVGRPLSGSVTIEMNISSSVIVSLGVLATFLIVVSSPRRLPVHLCVRTKSSAEGANLFCIAGVITPHIINSIEHIVCYS